jgi:hypothetical protein
LVCGYQRCASDPCFFWFRSGDGFLLAVVHVDDFVVAASTEAMLARFVRHMEQVYVVSVTPDVQHFLGLHNQEFPCGARLMSQPGLLRKLFDKHPDIVGPNRDFRVLSSKFVYGKSGKRRVGVSEWVGK